LAGQAAPGAPLDFQPVEAFLMGELAFLQDKIKISKDATKIEYRKRAYKVEMDYDKRKECYPGTVDFT
jgi:hypothetical protein